MALTTEPLALATWAAPDWLGSTTACGMDAGVWGFMEEGRPHVHTPEQRRALKEARVREGRAHAPLVFDDGRCVGWCQFGPTAELPRIKHRKAYVDGLRELPDWRITSFFVGGVRIVSSQRDGGDVRAPWVHASAADWQAPLGGQSSHRLTQTEHPPLFRVVRPRLSAPRAPPTRRLTPSRGRPCLRAGWPRRAWREK